MVFSISSISKLLPAVVKPTYKQTINKRLMWTGIALICYIVLSHIPIFGIPGKEQLGPIITFQTLLGARFGSLMTLGIGPIVTAGIILQLLVGSKIVKWDMTESEDRKKFQAWNKTLAFLFCFLEAIAFVLAGALGPVTGSILPLVILQLALGGIIVILLDELISKWGFGSGVSLFIVAGVVSQIFIFIFSPATNLTNPQLRIGQLWNVISFLHTGNYFNALIAALPIISTIAVFLIVIYIQNIGIDIPLTYAALRGFGRTWNLKLLYTSNIPVIFAAAIIANIQLIGRMSINPITGCSLLACYNQTTNEITGGLVYYLTSPRNLLKDAVTGTLVSSEVIRGITYLVFLVIICAIFSVFWVNTSGMDAESVAEQLESIGMQIPGYRSDKRTMAEVLNRYIPPVALLGGIFIGLIAALADFTGAIGTGTGILLSTMILYNYYEELSAERLEEAHPIIRKIMSV